MSFEIILPDTDVDARLVKGIAINGQEVFPVQFEDRSVELSLVLRSETDAEYLSALDKEQAALKAEKAAKTKAVKDVVDKKPAKALEPPADLMGSTKAKAEKKPAVKKTSGKK